ncbi:MAG: hypothetical protein WC767_03225, partial [Candidatus Paceibacterota bacterium]
NSVLPQAWNNLIDHRTISGCIDSIAPAPAISSLVTDSNTVVSGSSVTLTWATSDATSCTASGAWSGPVALSGSQVIGPLTATATTTQTFTLSCTGAAGTATQSTTITVVPASGPVTSSVSVSIAGVPSSVTVPPGGSVSITIASTATVSGPNSLTQHGIEVRLDGGAWQNAGAWNDPMANQARTTDASFTGLVISAAGAYEFRTYASIDGGASYSYSALSSMTATAGTVSGSAPSIASFSASPNPILSGAGSTLTWTTTGATSCTASGAWSGPVATSSSLAVGPFTVTATTTETFGLSCSNSTGTTTSSASLTINPAPVIVVVTPSISALSVSPNPVASGASATITWATTGATSCTASGAWGGSKAVSGSEAVGPFAVTAVTTETFILSCTNTAGTATSSASLVVNPPGGTATGTVSVTAPAGLSTSEYESTASFTVVLDSAPLADVAIPVSSSDTSEGIVSTPLLTFTPANWSVFQTVTVTGVDDAAIDGDITYAILLGAASSADVNWNGVNPSDVSIVNFDNDTGTSTVATTTISSFSVSPSAITSGGSVTLSWASANATLCVAGNSWSGNKSVTGSETVGPFTVSTATTFTFDISCGNASGTTTASTTLSVTPPAPLAAASSSGGGGGGRSGGPCVGYGCAARGGSGGGSTVPADVWILIDSVSSGGSASGPVKVCKYDDFLTSFMKRGISNDPNEVRKLQYFLNTYEA